jgi:hypothetical protein
MIISRIIADDHNPRAEIAADLAWFNWLARVETESGRDIPNLDSAYIAHRNGVTASDYALEVARAGEFLS